MPWFRRVSSQSLCGSPEKGPLLPIFYRTVCGDGRFYRSASRRSGSRPRGGRLGIALLVRWLRYLYEPEAWFDRRLRRLAVRGETECGLRVAQGTEAGLGRRWKHGVARISQGSVEFRPGLGGGIRFARPGQPWLRITVLEATRSEERTAGLKESWSVSGRARILRLRTATAEIEWAVVPQQRDALLATVRGWATEA
jgi:hypothetical protein